MLVGLCGYARSGKDTAADGLPERFCRWSFADPLKKAFDGTVCTLMADARMLDQIPDIFNIPFLDLHAPAIKMQPRAAIELIRGVKDEHKSKLRPGYVALGAGMRAICPDFWIRHLDARLTAHRTKKYVEPIGDDNVITDVRYLNEVKYILDQGGIVIYIKRPGLRPANAEERRSFKEIRDAVKAKQIKLIKVDNDSDIATLQERVNSLVTKNTKI